MTGPAYTDVEAWVIQFLAAQTGVDEVTATLPDKMETKLPVIQVERIGGGEGALGVDLPTLDVECFAATRPAANALANTVRHALRYTAPGTVLNGAVCAQVLTSSGPSWRPYGNQLVFRVGATYQVALHNQK